MVTPLTLKLWRERRGLTQADAASWIGVSPRTWRRWETGKQRIPFYVVRQFTRMLTAPPAAEREATHAE